MLLVTLHIVFILYNWTTLSVEVFRSESVIVPAIQPTRKKFAEVLSATIVDPDPESNAAYCAPVLLYSLCGSTVRFRSIVVFSRTRSV
jgi:hypothetical protein